MTMIDEDSEQRPQHVTAHKLDEPEQARLELIKWLDLAKKRYREIQQSKSALNQQQRAA